jgi:LuxR family maltose regulon positive regulatory protein
MSSSNQRTPGHLRQSKLMPPHVARVQVTRTALRERIFAEPTAQLVLINAPAGFGKTTVLLQLLEVVRQHGARTAWLTVDAADNDVGRFLGFLGAAVATLDGQDSELDATGNEASGRLALDVLDAIAAVPAPFALFIDDFEAIQNPPVLSLVRQMIEQLPQHGRVLIGSRTVPDLGIARLRAQGQVLEIHAMDLRFSLSEAEDFLQAKRGLALHSAEVARLQDVTEGWPVALWLASLALERSPYPHELAARFSAANTAVAEYLAEEVLARLPTAVREFMLRTSILRQLNASLCDTLPGCTGSQVILDGLERAGLLVQPANMEHDWFRYHSLFGSFLRTQLERLHPQELPHLQRAAAHWYEAQRRPIPAMEHALASGDASYALTLVDRHAEKLLQEGRIRLLVRLLDAAPAEDLVHWPRLRLIHAWALSLTRGGQYAMRLLDNIEASGTLDAQSRAHALALRAMVLNMIDRFDDAYAAGLQAVDHVPPSQAFAFSFLRTTLANLHVIMGRYASARDLLDRSQAVLEPPGGLIMTIYAQCVDGAIDLLHGRLQQATARFRQSAGAGARSAFMNTNGNSMAGILLAEALYEQNQLAESERLLNVYVPLMQEVGISDHLICGHRNLARIAHWRGDAERALQVVTQLEFLGHHRGLPRLVASAQLERARLALWRGDVPAAREALQRARATLDWSEVMKRSLFGNDADTLVEGQLRCMIHSGAAGEAVPLLKQELEHAEAAKRQRRALRLRILLALALERNGNDKAALRTLRDALQFGRQERFVRTFLDEGELLAQLLRKLSTARQPQSEPDASESRHYLESLLEPAPQPRGAAPQEVETLPQEVETLTRKELEILQLLAEGLSNLAIAERLFISETTVRTHLRSINAKFGSHSRTQAVAVARRLKLIV